MKEIIEKLLAAIPAFVRQLVGLLSGPKDFAAKLDFDAPNSLLEALTFTAVSFGAAFLIGIPSLPEKQNKELMFGILAVQAVLTLLLTIAVTVIAWKLVGGKFDWKKFLIISCYFCGISTLLWAAIELIGTGAANIIDPTHYQQLISGNTGVDPTGIVHTPAFIILGSMTCLSLIAVYVWTFCVWAAYRLIAGVSRLRSGIAFLIFVLLTPGVFVIQAVMTGTSGFNYHQNPPLPADLVGQWMMQHESDAGSTQQLRRVFYHFYVDNGYYIVDITRYTTGKCVKLVSDNIVGFAGVDGHSLTLIQKRRTRETKDFCSGQDVKAEQTLNTDIYQYRIDQKPDGWQLCLSDRFGETCYSPAKKD